MGEPAHFGAPDSLLYLPPTDQLLASADCPNCRWHGTAFIWPSTARMSSGGLRRESPVGTRRQACPDCGAPLTSRARHPSGGAA